MTGHTRKHKVAVVGSGNWYERPPPHPLNITDAHLSNQGLDYRQDHR